MNTTTQSDKEILAALIGPRQAERLYQGSLASLLLETASPGAGHEKLFAAQEFMRRALREKLGKRESLSRPDLVRDYLRVVFAGKEHEVFVVILLDNKHCLLEAVELFRGTHNQANVYPREVVKLALRHNAAAVIFAHNHPSSIAEPSSDDQMTTQRLKQALALVGVKVNDHFIVAGNICLSFAEKGML